MSTTIAASLTLDSQQAQQSVKSFRTQLREAQQDLIRISEEFGETSAEALAAARSVAGLRDRIQDAREVSELFDPAKRFQAFSNVVNVAAGGISALTGAMALFGDQSEEVQKTLVKVQGALALSQGLSALANAGEDISRFKAVALDAFKAIRTAIGSTGIGLLVIGVGLLVTYFDDIKEALFGVSAEQKEVLETTTKLADKERERLGHIDDQDNILKQQGKTEKQILEYKEKQTLEVIAASEAQLQAQKSIQDAQLKAVERNHDILAGLITFTAIPLKLIATAVDAILDKVGVKSGLNDLINKGINSATNLVFDPKATKEKAEKDNQALEDGITKLKNAYAGYQLQIKAINKKAADDEAAFQARLKGLRDAAADAQITDADKLAQIKLKQDYDNQVAAIKQEVLTKQHRNELLKALEEKYQAESAALTTSKLKDLNKQIADLEHDRAEAKKKADADGLANFVTTGKSNIQAAIDINNELAQSQLDAAGQQYETGLAKLNEQLAARLTAVKGNQELEKEVYADYERQKTELAQQENAQRLSIVSSTLGQAADLFGKATAAGKVLAVAQATIDTYASAVSSYKSLSGIPIVGPALGFAAAAVAVAAGLANVKKILSVKTPGGGGGGSVPSISASAPITPAIPQATNTILPQDQINQLGQAGNTVRAYVVSGDVTDAQEREVRVARAAKLGG